MPKKEFKYKNKEVDCAELTALLKANGFACDGVSYDGDEVTVHLEDTETKDPTALINGYVPTIKDIKKIMTGKHPTKQVVS